ncbi:hypothetical protein P280DRAFT_470619 [Massarina eburnea CBS 473.64]|uniref:Uncharacterized protein n=1 Tax=Massarina eburnea CBS 473.64 TaxID=1395130 RepID=A0A6A6RV78_9PLEO|nr:hypothetical protein P280DRAFT_470619 [Massarina eburnea CBS 473.64]
MANDYKPSFDITSIELHNTTTTTTTPRPPSPAPTYRSSSSWWSKKDKDTEPACLALSIKLFNVLRPPQPNSINVIINGMAPGQTPSVSVATSTLSTTTTTAQSPSDTKASGPTEDNSGKPQSVGDPLLVTTKVGNLLVTFTVTGSGVVPTTMATSTVKRV